MRNNDIMVSLCTCGRVCIIYTLPFVLCFSFRGRRTKVRKKTKYTILDNMDEQERMELQPKYSKFQQYFLEGGIKTLLHSFFSLVYCFFLEAGH